MYLKTEEVNLYYEVRGTGKPLLLIHGVVVDGALYQDAAEILSRYYQVITYDRRGNSRSVPVYTNVYDIDAQVRDAKALLTHLGLEKVFLVGASAGAIVAQEVLKACPEKVEHLLMYEPPLVPLLEEQEEERQWAANIEDCVARGKFNKAMLSFMLSLGETDERRVLKPKEVEEREMRNFEHFLQNEFHVFIYYMPDIEYYRTEAARITVAVGERSGESKYVRAARKFQELIRAELLHFPGCHNLPCDLPGDFANCLMGVMARYGW